jgi:C2HE / C2H2 / C2HC zinc-binding finger
MPSLHSTKLCVPRCRLSWQGIFTLLQMSDLKKSQYEPLLKDKLSCWRCGQEMKNMPAMKAHLQEEWEKEKTTEKAKLERKKRVIRDGPQPETGTD